MSFRVLKQFKMPSFRKNKIDNNFKSVNEVGDIKVIVNMIGEDKKDKKDRNIAKAKCGEEEYDIKIDGSYC